MQKIFNKFYKEFNNFVKSSNLETKTINKFIYQSIYQKILSIKYSYETRYIESDDNAPYRWTKSIFRKSFAEKDGKGAYLPLIKSKKAFFLCSFDYVLCLSNEPRISAELSYGKLNLFKKKKFKYDKKKIIKNSIIFCHISSYNPWHFYSEILSLTNYILDNNICKNKKIYLPENKIFKQIIKIIDKDERIEFYKCNQIIYTENCLFLEATVGELLLIDSIKLLTKKIHKKIGISNIKFNEVYIARADKTRNRRKMLNEKLAVKTIAKKYPKLNVIKPGYLPIISTIKLIQNSKKIFSALGTQLVLNSLFSKNLKLLHEIVPYDYYGFTTGQLVAKFLKTKYVRSYSKTKKIGYSVYNDQIIDISNLKAKL